mgnify:CR=1 FL=1
MDILHAGIAIIKVKGQPVGYMRNITVSENYRRIPVRGLGTIMPSEAVVTEWSGSLTCSFFEIDFKQSGIPGALRRDVGVGNARSQIIIGNNQPNLEDQLVLDNTGVQLDFYKKVGDILSPTGLIVPKLSPYAIISRCLIEGENINIDEGGVSGRNQSFTYLDAIVMNP